MRSLKLNTSDLRAGNRVCCAVSGGADSVALLLSLLEANVAKESLGVVLSVVHVHHGLRGAEADGDEAFVRALCERLGVPLRVEHVDTNTRQTEAGEGLEEAARQLRYRSFRALLEAGHAEVIATGHTLDDQAETVLMKLLRGAWTEGLGGITPVVALSNDGPRRTPGAAFATNPAGSSGRIVRPLLEVRRADIEGYLRERGEPWREDSSNRDLSLTRNRVRHELLPALHTFNPRLEELLAGTAAVARDEEAFWQAEVARVLPGLLLPGKPVRGGGRAVSTAVGEAGVAMELERLRSFLPALQRRLLRGAAEAVGCRISAEETAKLMALAGLQAMRGLNGRNGARLELGGGLRAERSLRELRLFRAANPTAMVRKM